MTIRRPMIRDERRNCQLCIKRRILPDGARCRRCSGVPSHPKGPFPVKMHESLTIPAGWIERDMRPKDRPTAYVDAHGVLQLGPIK